MKTRNQFNSTDSSSRVFDSSNKFRKRYQTMKKSNRATRNMSRQRPETTTDLGLSLVEVVEQLRYPYSWPTSGVGTSDQKTVVSGERRKNSQWRN